MPGAASHCTVSPGSGPKIYSGLGCQSQARRRARAFGPEPQPGIQVASLGCRIRVLPPPRQSRSAGPPG